MVETWPPPQQGQRLHPRIRLVHGFVPGHLGQVGETVGVSAHPQRANGFGAQVVVRSFDVLIEHFERQLFVRRRNEPKGQRFEVV